MARFRKIDPRIWNDELFVRMDPLDKLIVLYAVTAQSNRIGIFKFSEALAAEELQVDIETFRKR